MSVSSLTWTSSNGTMYTYAGQTANCTVSACPVSLSIYGYRPNLPFTSALISLYAIAATIQVILGLRYRSWGFMTAMLLGCVDEIIGYVGRIILYQNPWSHAGFIMQIVTITIGPVFFSAAIYVLLSQTMNYISPQSSRIAPRMFYRIFISLDVACLVLQAAGGAISTSTDGDSNVGVNIAMAGLALQVATLTSCICVAVDYAVRSRGVWLQGRCTLPKTFQLFIAALAVATILILARCSYRIYELNQGYQRTSSALRDQGLFIGLESVLIVVVAYVMILAHPALVLYNSQTVTPKDVEDGEQKSENGG